MRKKSRFANVNPQDSASEGLGKSQGDKNSSPQSVLEESVTKICAQIACEEPKTLKHVQQCDHAQKGEGDISFSSDEEGIPCTDILDQDQDDTSKERRKRNNSAP